jgi:acyl carrier protein
MEQQIRKLIQETLMDHDIPRDIDAAYDFVEQGKVDSLGLLSLATAIERHFGIQVLDHEWSKLHSIASIQAFVEQRRELATA